MTSTAEWLQQYGPWAMVVVCFSVIVFLFAALGRARDAHEAALEANAIKVEELGAEHKKEMEVILNRLIETTTTQVREYHALAEKITLVVDSLSRRIEGRSGR